MNVRIPLALSALLLAGPALAQTAGSAQVQIEASTGPVTVVSVQPPIPNAADYRATVAELDTNGDGWLSRSEVPERHALASEFRLVDTNRNGRITQDELSNWK